MKPILIAIAVAFASSAEAAKAKTPVPPEVKEKIRARCDKEWETDFRMVKHCVDKQTQAWRELQDD